MSSSRSPLEPEPKPLQTAEAKISAGTSTRQPRITPRNSDGDDAIASVAAKETPYGTLRQLANIPKASTPLRRASSAGPSSHRSARRTPTAQIRTPRAEHRAGGSARRPNALTPHGRAAMREIEARRAGLTPGKDRRRSGRQQRETPRDDLRALSRLMAPKTKPVVPTPEGPNRVSGRLTLYNNDDLDDGPEPIRPRFSLPLEEEDDDDDSLLLAPRSAGLEDENFTMQSVELPRRAFSEQPLGRLSRGSFGSVRMSDQFADFNELGMGGVFESSFAMGGQLDDDGNNLGAADQDDDSGTPRDLDLQRRRISLASGGRESDIRRGTFQADDTENSFVFTIPPRDVPDPRSSIGASDPPDDFENEDNGLDLLDAISEEELSTQPIFDEVDANLSLQDTTLQDIESSILPAPRTVKKKKVKISKHGIQYPSLPAGVVKKLATQFARTSGSKTKISKDTLDSILQASDWFFEQVSDDLGAYSQHAGRKTIDDSDIVTLMKRQRQTNATTTPFSLAQRYLPRELLQELRMVPPSKLKRGRQLQHVDEVEEE